MALLEARARHVLLMCGLGFGAVVVGKIFAATLKFRAQERFAEVHSPLALGVVEAVFSGLWVWFVLPVLVYTCCRYLELKPITTSVVAGVTGEVFWLGIVIASQGLDMFLGDRVLLLRETGTLVAGVALASWAGRQGRAWAERSEAESLERAKARKGQYDEFLKQAEALADKREANPIAPAAVPPAAAPAPAEPEGKPSPEAGEGVTK